VYAIDWAAGKARFGRFMLGEPSAAGKGLAREATALLVRAAFSTWRLRELCLEVLADNHRAQAVYAACGFRATGRRDRVVTMTLGKDEPKNDPRTHHAPRDAPPLAEREEYGAGPTFVLAVLGQYDQVQSSLAQTLERLEEAVVALDGRLIVGLEHRRWQTTPLMQTLGTRFPAGRLAVLTPEKGDRHLLPERPAGCFAQKVPVPFFLPGRLLTAAARQAGGGSLVFLWPGCLVHPKAVAAACRELADQGLDWLACVEPAVLQKLAVSAEEIGEKFLPYFLACGGLFPLCQAIIRRTSFLELGGFDPQPLLQRQFDAEFWLRSVRQGQRAAVRRGRLADCQWTWEDFPLEHDVRSPRYLAHSFLIRQNYDGRRTTDDGRKDDGRKDDDETLRGFLADLPIPLRHQTCRLLGQHSGPSSVVRLPSPVAPSGPSPVVRRPSNMVGLAALDPPYNAPYRIAVTGGTWEHAHNRLCFDNCFAELAGGGQFTYIPLLDSLLIPQRDLRGVDAVIISRGRHPNLRQVLDYCRRQAIPTICMIDDNWLSVGRDWPDPYAAVFAPGLPQYEMFLACLRECDAVLVYNDVLAADVGAYARRVIRLPVNVRRADFAAPLRHAGLAEQVRVLVTWREQTAGLIAGYAGSVRYCDGAFRALAAAARRAAPPLRPLLFGSITPAQQALFDGQAAVLPYVAYADYAAAMGALRPDILLAPLDRSHTSHSKCPNKYLEYSMAGAAGIYSDTPPYSQVVADGKTGLLLGGDDEAAWSAALARLAGDAVLRQGLAAEARRDVLARFETAVVAPQFAAAIDSVIRAHRLAHQPAAGEAVPC
jgi:hypothetical protein